MKKNALILLAVMLWGVPKAFAYDFSAVAPSGQTLYYSINDDGTSVSVVGPSDYGEYSGFTEPTGALTIPSIVSNGGSTYNVTAIGSRAFEDCIGLTSVTIPNSVTSIGERTFYHCYGLTSLTIPNSVTSIGEGAFHSCYGLTSVTIPNSVTSIGKGTFSDCSGLTSVTIPNSVTSIGEYAFYACSGLTSVTIPNSVTSIGENAFSRCRGLTSVTIPNSVTTIGSHAFNSCDHLTNLRFGSGLQSIGRNAFKGCTQVVRIKSFATTAPTIDSTVFKDLSDDVILNVPCGYGSVYENAAYWHRFDIQEDLMYDFSVRPQDPSRGTVQILNAPSCDNYEAQIQANAYHNYHFARWSDGNTDNPRYIVVMQDVNLEAIFLAEGETEGIDDVEEGALRVWANSGHIYVATDNAAGAETSVEVYDMKGCKVATMATDEESPLFPKGVYLVKVGTLAAKKVVVF